MLVNCKRVNCRLKAVWDQRFRKHEQNRVSPWQYLAESCTCSSKRIDQFVVRWALEMMQDASMPIIGLSFVHSSWQILDLAASSLQLLVARSTRQVSLQAAPANSHKFLTTSYTTHALRDSTRLVVGMRRGGRRADSSERREADDRKGVSCFSHGAYKASG